MTFSFVTAEKSSTEIPPEIIPCNPTIVFG